MPGVIRKLIDKAFANESPKTSSTESPWGILEVTCKSEGTSTENPVVDVVFVHGLNGNRERTWTAKNGILWPRDLLADEIKNARLLTFGWDARTYSSDVLSATSLSQHGNNLLQELSIYRRSTNTRHLPILFVAHSLGGLILKSGLVNAHLATSDHNTHLREVSEWSYGIIFLGVPHQGSGAAGLGEFLLNLKSVYLNTDTRFVKHMKEKSEWLENNMMQFANISNKFHTCYCYEAFPVVKHGLEILIVPFSSAVPPGQRGGEIRQFMKNHTTMTKFENKQDNDYQALRQMIKEMCREAATWTGQKADFHIDERHRSSAGTIVPDLGSDKFEVSFDSVPTNNAFFTGRRNELEKLCSILVPKTDTGHDTMGGALARSPVSTMTAVLQGLGGVGKTQIAREFAYSYRHCFTSIFWFDAHSLDTLLASFVQLAEQLISRYKDLLSGLVGVEHAGVQAAFQLDMVGSINETGNVLPNCSKKIVGPVKKWFQAQGNGQWLLIYDNYDHPQRYKIGEYLPNSGHGGSILITSRRDECYTLCKPESFLSIKSMTSSEGIELLLKYCNVADSSTSGAEYEEARQIVEALGHLPLAIDLAGSYLRKRRCPLKNYLKIKNRMLKTLNDKPLNCAESYEYTVFTTWEVSFAVIDEDDPESADFLLLWGFLSNEKIQVEMLQRGMGLEDDEVRNRIGPLLSFSLVSRTETGDDDAFTVHPLVHEWARIRQPNQSRRLSAEALCVVASSIFEAEIWTTGFRKTEHWAFERQLMAHIEATSTHVRSAWSDSETFYEHAEHWVKYAHVYFYLGRYREAEEIYSGVVTAYRSHLQPSEPKLLRAVRGLATIKRFQGDYEDAQRLYEEARDGFTETLGPDDIETLQTIQSLAVVYRHLGRLQDSIALYEWALHGSKRDDNGFYRKSGAGHHYTIHTVLGLAIVYQHRGLYTEAVEHYNEVVSHRVSKLGPDHPDTLVAKQNLADGLGRKGQYQEAMQLFKEVLDSRISHLGRQHPDTLRTIDCIGILYRHQKEWAKAQTEFNKAYLGRRQSLGDSHPDTLATIQNMAVTYREQSKDHPYDTDQFNFYLRKAEAEYKKAHSGRKKALGVDHTDTMKSWEGLALISEARGDHGTARDYYEDVKAGFEKHLVPESDDVKRAGAALRRLSELLDAREIYR